MMAMTVEQMNDTVVIAYRVITMFLVAIIKIRKARTTLVLPNSEGFVTEATLICKCI